MDYPTSENTEEDEKAKLKALITKNLTKVMEQDEDHSARVEAAEVLMHLHRLCDHKEF